MCGIFFFDLRGRTPEEVERIRGDAHAYALEHRGPDASAVEVIDGRYIMGFHRLAIIGTSADQGGGMQPLRSPASSWALLCNGEIYNYEALASAAIPPRCDVEVILSMLQEVRGDGDAARLAARIDGDFAFVAVNAATGDVVAARDPLGVRPMFYGVGGEDGSSVIAFASEAKALVGAPGVTEVRVFPPGHAFRNGRTFQYYAIPPTGLRVQTTASKPEDAVRASLVEAVRKRIAHSDHDVVGVLCSGGIDSAAITCIAHSIITGHIKKMKVFTMRYRNGQSDDAFYAALLCAHLGCVHETIEFGPEDIDVDASTIAAVIRACETCDPNTIRAAIPMYLLAKAIKARAPEVKVVLSGEGADELFGGYNYFRLAPGAEAASAECDRLLRNLHMFDLLRADRCFAAHGIEVRVPFLDPALIETVAMTCSAAERVRGEKQLLRDAVSCYDALSRYRILDRPKEKFSDGAGFTYVPDLLRAIAAASPGGDNGTLPTRLEAEQVFYREIFDREFGACACRHEWVVERELPAWKAIEARRKDAAGGAGVLVGGGPP
jgi:asparagine synthase (glutamine-hydrolysing)